MGQNTIFVLFSPIWFSSCFVHIVVTSLIIASPALSGQPLSFSNKSSYIFLLSHSKWYQLPVAFSFIFHNLLSPLTSFCGSIAHLQVCTYFYSKYVWYFLQTSSVNSYSTYCLAYCRRSIVQKDCAIRTRKFGHLELSTLLLAKQ